MKSAIKVLLPLAILFSGMIPMELLLPMWAWPPFTVVWVLIAASITRAVNRKYLSSNPGKVASENDLDCKSGED